MPKAFGLLLIMSGLLLGCEPIIDLSTDTVGSQDKTQNGVIKPTLSTVRPKNVVQVPSDPIEQIRLLSDDATKGWLLKKRVKENVDVTNICLQDDGIILHKTQRIDFEVGDIKCGVSDRKVSGTWQLTDRPSLLLSSGGTPPYEAQILELSKNRMILSYRDVTGDSFVETYETPVIEPEPEPAPIVLPPSPTPSTAPTATAPTVTVSPIPSPTSSPAETEASTGNTGDFSGF